MLFCNPPQRTLQLVLRVGVRGEHRRDTVRSKRRGYTIGAFAAVRFAAVRCGSLRAAAAQPATSCSAVPSREWSDVVKCCVVPCWIRVCSECSDVCTRRARLQRQCQPVLVLTKQAARQAVCSLLPSPAQGAAQGRHGTGPNPRGQATSQHAEFLGPRQPVRSG